MATLVKSVRIIQTASGFHDKVVDLLIDKGKIVEIGTKIDKKDHAVFERKGLCVSAGWLDIGTHLGEPGMEQRETFSSLARAAIQGGYTAIAPFSNEVEPAQSRSSIEFLLQNAKKLPIHLYPIGLISRHFEESTLTEMLDMHAAGARAFSDGLRFVSNESLLLKALQYSNRSGAAVLHAPALHDIHGNAMLHEGSLSAELGLSGFPREAESIALERDITLQSYTQSKLAIHGLSTKESARRVLEARKKSGNLLAGVAALNLLKTTGSVSEYNTDYKLLPPLREEADRKALIKAIEESTIDYIFSNHQPLEPEVKDLEFPLSGFGSTGLVQAFGAARQASSGKVPLQKLIEAITIGPRKVLDIEETGIEEGAKAELTFFLPDEKWCMSESHERSKSRNTALKGEDLMGRAVAIANKGRFIEIEWE